VDAVHKNGSSIFLQLRVLGRTAHPDVLQEEGGHPLLAPSSIPLNNTSPSSTPHSLTVEEIREYVQLFATAAQNTILGARFDGIGIHAVNRYLPDQFLQMNTNKRTDSYGNSVENHACFVLEVTEAVINAVGENKVGICFSPWSTFQGECD
jgi:NADPH2 dehydrogenase